MKCELCGKVIWSSYFIWINGNINDVCHDCYKKHKYKGGEI